MQLRGLSHKHTFLLGTGWLAAKWFWQKRELTKLQTRSDSPPHHSFSYADMLKKEIIVKKDFWLHLMLFQDSPGGI